MTPWDPFATHQAPSIRGFSRQKYWSSLPHPASGDLPNPGSTHVSYISSLAGGFLPLAPPGKSPTAWCHPLFTNFFNMWTILKTLLNSLQYCPLLYVLVFGTKAYGILASQWGIELALPTLKSKEALTTRPGSTCHPLKVLVQNKRTQPAGGKCRSEVTDHQLTSLVIQALWRRLAITDQSKEDSFFPYALK